MKLASFTIFKKQSPEERKAEQDRKELERYRKRQEKYDDMIRDETQKQKYINRLGSIKANTFTKKMVITIISICLIDIQISYLLAFFDKMNPLSELSGTLCTTILGVAFVYMIRAYFDSKAEHKNLDAKIKADIEEKLADRVNDALNAAGINNVNAEDFIKKKDDEEPEAGFHFNISMKKDNNDNGVG